MPVICRVLLFCRQAGKGEELEGRGKGLCNEDIVVLGQLCAKSLLSTFTHTENAPVKLICVRSRDYQIF